MRLNESSVCRLCAAAAPSGSHLFLGEGRSGRSLADLVNAYLPLEVIDEGEYPKTICPGCNIQLEATAQFFDLIMEGQNKLRQLWIEENPEDFVTSLPSLPKQNPSAHLKYKSFNIHPESRPIATRKRGRPKKTEKEAPPAATSENPTVPVAQAVSPVPADPTDQEVAQEDNDGKRKRKPPKRFNVIQGNELNKIYQDQGVSDDETATTPASRINKPSQVNNEIIGYIEHEDGTSRVVVKMGKGKRKGTRSKVNPCPYCPKKFPSQRLYLTHIALEHSDICDDSSKTEKTEEHSVISIISDIHSETISAPTELPDNIFGPCLSMPDLTLDILNHSTKEGIKNDLPDLETNHEVNPGNEKNEILDSNTKSEIDVKSADANIIQIEQFPKKKFQCSLCERIFRSKQNAQVHYKAVHLGERHYKCSKCTQSFAYKLNLQRHLLSHNPRGATGFGCDICGKILNHPSSVLYHKDTVHNVASKFVCKTCGKVFKHRLLLQKHQTAHSDLRPFSCIECSASFKTKKSLLGHMQIHSVQRNFECELCTQKFIHKNSLAKHLRMHTGEKPYKCSVCEKAFGTTGNLNEHMRIHTGETPFECQLCDRRFKTSSQYRLHAERHVDEQRWLCQQCGRKFTCKDSWKSHTMRNHAPKKFSCSTCSRKFPDRWSLNKHMRLHSGERPFACDICKRAFADSSNLKKHRKTHLEIVEKKQDVVIFDDTVDNIINNENQVLCVTYNVDANAEDETTFRIINENEVNGLTDCGLYQTGLLIEDDGVDGIVEEQTSTIFDHFVDEEGNPIQLALADGKLLQIQNDQLTLTSDGQFQETIECDDVATLENHGIQFLAPDDGNLSQYFRIVE